MQKYRFTTLFLITVLLVTTLFAAFPASAQGGVMVNPNANLNMRAQPNTNAAVLGRVPFDTQLPANAISPDRNWVAIVYNGQGGWISLLYTSVLSGSLGDLPVSNETFTPNSAGGGQVTSSVYVAPTVNLRYRTEPTLDVRPSGAVPFNTRVPALAVSADGLFVMVNYQGQNVWLYREYVTELEGALSSFTPGAAPISGGAAPAAAPAATTSTTTTAPASGRAGLFIVYDGTTSPHPWHTQLAENVRASGIASARIVAYLRENLVTIESCNYVAADGSGRTATLNRVRVEYIVTLVDGESGNPIDQRTFARDPEGCPGTFSFSSGSAALQPGPPPIEDALGWFAERLGG